MVEVAREVFNAADYTVHDTLVPWKRAVIGTKSGLFDGVIGAPRTETARLAKILPDWISELR